MKEITDIPFIPLSDKIPHFEIIRLESLFQRKKDNLLNHPLFGLQRVGFNIIIFITEGKGSHLIDFKQHDFSSGKILFISNRQIHSFDPEGSYKGYLVLFTNSFFLSDNKLPFMLPNHGFNFQLMSPTVQLTEEKSVKYQNSFNDIMEEYHADHDDDTAAILKSSLNTLLFKLKREMKLKKSFAQGEYVNVFSAFQELLFEHFKSERNASVYAEKLNMTYKHLNTICKRITQLPVKAFIDNYIVLESKRYLRCTDLSTKELAYELGFDEPSNFSKYFKKHTGQTPADFKNNQ